MRVFVIAITHHPKSMESANKCIASCQKYGIEPEVVPAFTPKDNPLHLINTIIGRVLTNNFQTQPKPDAVAATFATQLMLWSRCATQNEEFLILEHDARMIRPLPIGGNGSRFLDHKGVVTHGKPSWGHPEEEKGTGLQDVDNGFFLGNHAIQMSPKGAKNIMDYLRESPSVMCRLEPADCFLNSARFDFLQKFYPYTFEVEDNFSFIQSGHSVEIKVGIDLDNYEELDADENIYHHNKS